MAKETVVKNKVEFPVIATIIKWSIFSFVIKH